ncbi:MAG TPA: translocation/assembly module TamB domain-containing protein [Salinivirgaceae bacterium]|nr:translocation/assembly module TamB domain-containing protein [Salinivirgaceae bacterium]
MRKAIKRIRKIVPLSFAVISLLPFIVYLLLLDPKIQTFIVQKTTRYIKDTYGLRIEIGSIQLKPISSLLINNLLVEDLSGDTLFYARKLNAGIHKIKIDGPQLFFDKIELDSMKFFMRTDSLDNFNLDYVLALFEDSLPTSDTTPSNFRIHSRKVVLSNSEYLLKSYKPESVEGINFEHLHIFHLNSTIAPLDITNDTIKINVTSLTAQDHSGFTLDTLSAEFIMDPQSLRFENLKLRYGNTSLVTQYVRLIKMCDTAYSDFLNQVSLETNILKSQIVSDDLWWFSPELKQIGLSFELEGSTTGSINYFNLTPIYIKLLDSTTLQLSGTIEQMTETEKLFVDLNYLSVSTTPQNLKRISLLNDSVGNTILPEEIFRFSYLNYAGKFSGTLEKFNTSGLLNTNLGQIIHRLSYSRDKNSNTSLEGQVKLNRLNLGRLLELEPTMGQIDLELNLNGTLHADNTFASTIQANIAQLNFNQYNYKHIVLKGNLTDKAFQGEFSVDDENLMLFFSGKIEYNTPQLHQHFLLQLPKINLYALHFDSEPRSVLSMNIVANFYGLDLDSLLGKINIFDFTIQRRNKETTITTAKIGFEHDSAGRKLYITNPLFSLTLSGNYSYNTISDIFSNAISKYAPSLAWTNTPVDKNDPTHVSLKINLTDIQPLITIFDTTLIVSKNSNFEINYRHFDQKFELKGQIANIIYGDQHLNNIRLTGFNDEKIISTSIGASHFFYTKDYSLKNLTLSSIIHENKIIAHINWNNYNRSDTTNYSGYIASQIILSDSNSFKISIQPSFVVISDTTWNIAPATINIKGDNIEIDKFDISYRNQHLKVNGKISKNPEDNIYIKTQNINLAMANILLEKMADITIGGKLSADVTASNLYSNPFVLAQIELDKFSYNGQLLGDTKITSHWDSFLEMIHVDWVTSINNYDVFYIVGDYDPNRSFVNFRLFMDRFNLMTIAPYLTGTINNLEGLMTAELIIKGKIDAPKIEGVVIFDRTTFEVDYTKTRYQITDWLDISPEAIIFSDFRIVDENNNFILLNGKLSHTNFDNFVFDLKFNARNFMFLNTLEKDNPSFFGSVFCSGEGAITGPLNTMDITASNRTEKNTRIFIPLNSGATATKANYIRFVNTPQKDISVDKVVAETPKSSNNEEIEPNIMLNLEITPEAEIQIIFDPTIGDIIKAKGSSNLTIYMPRGQDIEMFGDYIITEGDYLFTLQDIFQKRFSIAKGSTIMWSGDPANANLEIDAIYRVRRASLYELTYNQADQEIRVNADAHLIMGGTIMNPTISFKITLPSTSEEAQDQLNNLPHDEISKQVISLLILNRFQPLPGAVKTADASGLTGVESNASELLSNQVSNWLSQVSNTFDIGFNYTPGGQTNSQEYEFAVSTQLLNNRVTINSNIGVGGQQLSTVQSGSNLAGDFEMEVKLDQRGRIRVKGYQKIDNRIDNHSKQGAGIFYREEFNTLSELWEKFFKKNSPK